MNDTVTHLAGPVVGYEGRGIQRCAVCGEKLLDSKGMKGPVGPSGEPPELLVWREGCLVEVDGNRSSDLGMYVDADPVPDSFCLFALVE